MVTIIILAITNLITVIVALQLLNDNSKLEEDLNKVIFVVESAEEAIGEEQMIEAYVNKVRKELRG